MILTLLFASLSGLAMTVLFALCPTLSFWWRLPIWLGLYVVVALTCIILLVLALYLFLPKGNPSPRLRRFTQTLVKLVLSWVLVMLGIRTTVKGADKLPSTPYLLVGNHRSAFDPLCALVALSDEMIFVAKPSVLKIPVIGPVLERMCFLAIDRENARNAVATIKRSAELIRDVGLSVGIAALLFLAAFPENLIWADVSVGLKEAFGQLWTSLMENMDVLSSMTVTGIISALSELIVLMLAVTIGAMVAKKHKILAAVGVYYGISMVQSFVLAIANLSVVSAENVLHIFSVTGLTSLVIAISGYFLMHYLTDKKLNLT